MAKKPSTKRTTKSKASLRRRKGFSGAQLVFFALIFALVGGLVIWKGFAAGPGTCVIGTPTVSADNNYQWATPGSWGLPGQQLKYAAQVYNHDFNCTSSSFTVAATAPDGFSVSIPSSTVTLKSSMSAYVWVYITSPNPIANGDYPLNFSVTRAGTTSPVGTGTNYYKVYSSDTTVPKLYWNNPGEGQVISSKGKGSSSYNIVVESNDDHAVMKIETYLDGGLVNTANCDNTWYACSSYYKWSPKGQVGQHVVTWKSYDWLGNIGTLTANFSVN